MARTRNTELRDSIGLSPEQQQFADWLDEYERLGADDFFHGDYPRPGPAVMTEEPSR
ncbi:MAG: hypothetical protein HYR62_01805 [Actinobacteria bacterium]|nr:hypothetical protein [Actinomycetota bacterium]MBI3687217.1 hypothetical protein [Actinomycetota bacterium]